MPRRSKVKTQRRDWRWYASFGLNAAVALSMVLGTVFLFTGGSIARPAPIVPPTETVGPAATDVAPTPTTPNPPAPSPTPKASASIQTPSVGLISIAVAGTPATAMLLLGT
ncbi:MAG TPA: hypothetical protein VF932_06920 [Anaerolineae bacterium]